ncbi:uncharacterized protein SPAPADRAFT_130860 [Spathaspora passalidarum NRRL Y-27907]|uniref:Cohesin loading factor n=1 Tax=Spathaspora passalidarum (strain NRRL Y-27907 / 11-Y1) TaxID=619300 RepID=G3AGD4_SPAPN|nr:uncharacterized protein SPAPADRAFT_130860 [Spathaspora passalidarum NRRL Y-27907]EGW35273.1 hypothetical protein SPAPADRAFT_130860 [Spathaspora passalidarum NRRL Y-27907]
MISYYIGQSDRFVRLAYQSSTITGLENHNKFIILAIKMLLIVTKKYKAKLKPKQESIVYYRLGKLYLIETTNIHKAEEYINKALDIANFHEFKQIRFYCELLLAQILETTNLKLCANYVFSKGQYYKQKGDHVYSNLFQLLRIKSLIVSDCATALVVLQGSILDPNLNDSIKCLCLIYEANLHCYRGSPDIAIKLLGEAEQLAYRDGDNPIMPVQIDGMILLCRLTAYSNMNMVAEAESCRKLISNYIKAQTEEGWKSWNDNGIVRVEIDELDHDTTIPFLFRWLNSDEFVITYYLITGSTYMSHDGYSEKVFDRCLQMISDQKKRISNGGSKSLLSPREVANRMLKLRYLQFVIAFYKTWIGFLKGEYKKITNMNVFMNENNSKFSSEEYSCFKPLLPLIYYMFAAFYQDKGDIQAAKYYYLKVRTMTSSNMSQETKKSPEQIINTSLFQLQLGIGCDALAAKGQFNELYVFSSIQLYILLEFQLTEIKQNVSNVKDQQMLEDHVNLKSELVQELRNIFKAKQTSNSFAVNFTGSNLMLTITYFLVNDILSETQEGDKSGIEPSLEASFHTGLKLLGKKTTFTLMHFLISNYILTKSSNMDQKERISEMVKEQVAQNGLKSPQSTPDLSKIIRVMLLKHLQKKYHSVGDLQNAKMAELQSSYYYKCLQDKFKFLFENTRYFDKGDIPVAKINSESPPTTSDSVERKQLDR